MIQQLDFFGEAHKIWDGISGKGALAKSGFDLEKHRKLLSMFQVGDYYYFIFNVKNGDFDYLSPSIHDVLGFDDTISARQHLSHLHPEDQPVFLNFEKTVDTFFRQLPHDKLGKYKIRYDFRVRNNSGKYVRILHQMVIIEFEQDGSLLRSLGIHTDITHLKETGKPMLSFIGLEGEPSYVNVEVENIFKPTQRLFTQRENEVVRRLATGLGSKQIAEELHISKATVDTHRKNILRKANCESTYELISKVVNEGWA
ncbi:MAG: helix-turn-helix transcriptional regulator [Flavobacterium sp.]|uniref:LuxR C-terminal-related transcriptional regulator n=1 Tax=Flavobacterium sp. TaxID=239 RepID=UPI00120EEFAD|nr:LuxR C-terminal-related transcriptional regulator [Flavobacterium sp.]RZJ66215.1 MAG: helix-turn-helix transcriptional regulator [Flavobacterium sp.]